MDIWIYHMYVDLPGDIYMCVLTFLKSAGFFRLVICKTAEVSLAESIWLRERRTWGVTDLHITPIHYHILPLCDGTSVHKREAVTPDFEITDPYKYSPSGPPEGLGRRVFKRRQTSCEPLGGTEVGWKVGPQGATRGSPPLSLLFTPLALLSVSWFSTALVLASKSLLDATILPLPEALSLGGYRRQAYCVWNSIIATRVPLEGCWCN